jgi:NDP-sugar pyrophosphorylase family protein
MGEYKVLITTSGLGSRLGSLTNYTNKSLIRVADKPAISYIIDYLKINVSMVNISV